MKVNNLQVGKEYKWKEMCDALEIPYKTGNVKIKQMKEFESKVKFEKNGTKYKILEIYDEAKKIIDGRSGRENKMSIDYLLSRMIVKKTIENKDCYLQSTTMCLLKDFGIIKEEFKENKKTMFDKTTSSDDAKYLYKLEDDIEDFMKYEYDSLEAHVREAMNKVNKMRYFKVYRFPILTFRKWNEEKMEWTIVKSMALKTTEEMQEIQNVKSKIIEDLGGDGDYTEYQWLFGKKQNLGKYREFNKQFEEYLFEKYEMNSMYEAWGVITKNKKNREKIKESFKEDFDNINKIYDIIYNKRLKSAEKRQDEYFKIKGEGEFIDKSRLIWIETHNLIDSVKISKVNGKYVERWNEIFKELMY